MANEKRNLIDRDELIDSLGISDMEIFAKEVIEEAPIVDAVEVVRCKNCKKAKEATLCDFICTRDEVMIPMDADDFCSYGERKDNG